MNKAIENNNRRPGYKKTKLGWIPEEWQIQKLKHVAKFSNGKAHEMHIQESGSFILINSKFISTDGAVKKYTEENLKPLCKGDIVMVMSDVPNGKAIAKCYLIEENNKYTLNQRICSLTAKDVDNVFLFYQLNRNTYYLRFDDGVGQTNLRKNQVLDCPLRIPPLPEQKKIAEILSTWDRAIETLEQLIAKKEELKRGLMQELLSGKTRFPGFEGEWQEVRLDKIAKVIMGQSPNSEFYNEVGNGLPLLQGNNDIKNGETVATIFTTEITKECKIGDIVLSVRAPVGDIGIALNDCCIGRGVCAIQAEEPFRNYLYNYLNYYSYKWDRYSQGSTFKAINSRDIRGFKIEIPADKEEIELINKVIDSVSIDVKTLKNQNEFLKTQKKGLIQQLLTGKTRVKTSNID